MAGGPAEEGGRELHGGNTGRAQARAKNSREGRFWAQSYAGWLG